MIEVIQTDEQAGEFSVASSFTGGIFEIEL